MEGEPESTAPTRILLHEYAKSGATDLVLAELDDGAVSVDVQSSLGDTAMHWAARGNHAATLTALAQRGARVDVQNNQGDTPLHLASFKGHADACRALVKMGASRVILNKSGQRALDVARSTAVKAVVAPEDQDADGYEGSGSDEDDF